MEKFGELEEVYLMREKKEQGGASKCAAFVKVCVCVCVCVCKCAAFVKVCVCVCVCVVCMHRMHLDPKP